MPGAHNAVETCLAVRPGEHVALIADKASRAVAASIAAALEDETYPIDELIFSPSQERSSGVVRTTCGSRP